MNFSLKQLQIFLAIVHHGSTLAAANALEISQPAVSAALAGLEASLDTKLFHRWKKRIILNDRGRSLLPMARRLVDNARELDQMFKGGDDQISGTLRLGASRTLASYVMPEILSGFASSHPAVKIEVISRNKSGIIEQIEDFSLDIGVIAGISNSADVRSHSWLMDELCVFCSSHHPLAEREMVSEKDLEQSLWILREEGSGTLEVFYRALPEHLKPLNVLMVMDNLESIKRTIENVNALSCVSKFAIRREVERGELRILETPFLDLRREYSFLVHREKERSQLLSYFVSNCLLAEVRSQKW